MASRKILVVAGATGKQGSSVAKTFLQLPNWQVRCLTRNPSSAKSEALAALGAEIVQADLSDVESLSKGFANAHAIFLNTDFWELFRSPSSPTAGNGQACFDREVSYGKNAARAAAGIPSLERFIYSTLTPMEKVYKPKFSPYHSIAKPTIVEHITTHEPELAKKMSLIFLGGYTNNPFISPRYDPTYKAFFVMLPIDKSVKFPIIDAENSTGPFVRALIEDEDIGTKLLAYDSYLSVAEVVDLWSKASGQNVAFLEVTPEVMNKKYGISEEVLDGPLALAEHGYMGGTDAYIEPHQLKNKVETKSFEQWLKERDWEETLTTIKAASAPKA